jgi:hypothetical protein
MVILAHRHASQILSLLQFAPDIQEALRFQPPIHRGRDSVTEHHLPPLRRRWISVFATAFLSVGFGSIIVAFHNVWSGIPIVLTLLGWAQILKKLVYFTWPSHGLRKLQLVSEERANLLIIPGIAFVAIAALMLYNLDAQS